MSSQDPMDDLTIALEFFPVEDYVNSKGIASMQGKGQCYLTCPKCNRDKLAVNLRTGAWRCFICEQQNFGEKAYGYGRIWGLVQWMENLDNRGTYNVIRDLSKAAIKDGYKNLPVATKYDMMPKERTPTGLPEGAVAITTELPYMIKRGITMDHVRKFGLCYVPKGNGWVSDRLVFPVWKDGKALFWQARACWEQAEHPLDSKFPYKKILNPQVLYCHAHGKFPVGEWKCHECAAPPQYGSGEVLYNLEQASKYEEVVITEGPISCIHAGNDAICTFGKNMTPQQMRLLADSGVKSAVFMWDGPSAKEPYGARKEMIKFAGQLASIMAVKLVFLPREDPCAFTPKQIAELRSLAVSYTTNLGDHYGN